jgi:hypothetical protein
MTTTIDNQQRHHLGLGYDSMSYPTHSPHSQFGHPWGASAPAAPSNAQLFPSLGASGLAYDPSRPPPHRTSAATSMRYPPVPPIAPSMAVGSYLPHPPFTPSYDQPYSGRPSQASGPYASSSTSCAPLGPYSQALVQHQQRQHEQPLAQSFVRPRPWSWHPD